MINTFNPADDRRNSDAIQRAEAAEARATEYAESCGGKVQPNDEETWVECVNRLAGELASRDEREHAPDIALSQERDELAAQLATANTLAHTRLQKIEYLETALEACREMQHNAERRVNELQEWYNESVKRNEASSIGAQILENERNDARAQLATAQAALESLQAMYLQEREQRIRLEVRLENVTQERNGLQAQLDADFQGDDEP